MTMMVRQQNPMTTRSRSKSVGFEPSTMLLILALIALGWFLLKRKPVIAAGQYLNEEKWTVKYEDGLPVEIVIKRDAKRT